MVHQKRRLFSLISLQELKIENFKWEIAISFLVLIIVVLLIFVIYECYDTTYCCFCCQNYRKQSLEKKQQRTDSLLSSNTIISNSEDIPFIL